MVIQRILKYFCFELLNLMVLLFLSTIGVPARPPHISVVASDTNSLRLYVETGQALTNVRSLYI